MQDSVYDKFLDLLVEKVKSTPTGDGFDETVTSGPIVSEPLRDLRVVLRTILIDLKSPIR